MFRIMNASIRVKLCMGLCISMLATMAHGQDRPLDFGRQWIRQRPLTLAAAANDINFNINQYLGLNLNMVYANNNTVALEAAVAADIPWQMHYNTSTRPFTAYTATDKARINELIAMGNATAWMLPDEPVETSEYIALGESAQWMRENHPELLTYVGVGRGQPLDDAFLQEVIGTIKPDALMFDWYPFLNDGVTDTNRYFSDIMAVRKNSLQAGIPYWAWMQSFYMEGRNERAPSESDTRYNGFTLLTAGYTGLVYFTYDTHGLMFEDLINYNPTPLYHQAAAANLEYANIGQALRFLTSEDVRFLRGRSLVNIFGLEFEVPNSRPSSIDHWSAGAGGDPHILSAGVDAGQLGSDKNGLLGFFTDDNGEHYFMLTNLNHGATLSAAEAALSFTIQFDGSIDSIWLLNRTTGLVEEIILTDHTLRWTLPGGTGDLFKYGNGNFVGLIPEPMAISTFGFLQLLMSRRRSRSGTNTN